MIVFRTFVGLFLYAVIATSSVAEIQFSSVLTGTDQSLFSLTDLETHVSRWVLLGGSFEGFKLANYDDKNQILTLSKDQQSLRLPLKMARIKDAKQSPVLKGKLSIEIGKNQKYSLPIIMLNYGEEMIFALKDDLICQMIVISDQNGGLNIKFSFETVDPAGQSLGILARPQVKTRPAQRWLIGTEDFRLEFVPD